MAIFILRTCHYNGVFQSFVTVVYNFCFAEDQGKEKDQDFYQMDRSGGLEMVR